MNINWQNLIVNIILTGIFFMIFPLLKFKILRTEEYTKEQIKKTCIINSIVVELIFIILGTHFNSNYKVNVSPAIFWYFINIAIFTKKKKQRNKIDKREMLEDQDLCTDFLNKPVIKKNKEKKKHKVLFIILIICFILSILINIFLYISYINLDDEYSTELAINRKLQDKVDFFNNNIAFVIKGDNTYYYSYDCLNKKYDNYSYLAFNKEQAEAKGYIQYDCSPTHIETLREYAERNN